jgi:hypothetical protein
MQRHNLEILNGLLGCQNIQSIKADIVYKYPEPACRLKEVLMGCQNLDILHLRTVRLIGETGMFLTGAGSLEQVFDLGVEPGDKLAPLRELVYEMHMRGFYIEVPLIPNSFWDWTRLRHLELRGSQMIQFVNAIQGQIPSLEVLKLEHMDWTGTWAYMQANNILNDLVSGIQGLIQFELVDAAFQLLPSTISLQSKLKSLSYYTSRHCRKPGVHHMPSAPEPFSAGDIKLLATSCSELSSLALHMAYVTDDLVIMMRIYFESS